MNGVVYYNVGNKMLVRLAVSIHSLRKVYNGNVSILASEDSKDSCFQIANEYGVDVRDANFEDHGKNTAYLNSCLSHTVTPYDNTLWIDSDSLIFKDFSEVFGEIEKNDFVIAQFHNWTSNRGHIRKRILEWKKIYPEMMDKAINFGPGINCGVYGFNKESKLMKDWYQKALPGIKNFIPDEVCCQIMLPFYTHSVISNDYNTSCKYDVVTDTTKIVHYHGRKHCRISDSGEYLNNSRYWYNTFDEIRDKEYVEKHIKSDRQLRKNLEKHDG